MKKDEFPVIPATEYSNRIAAFRARMQKDGIDLAVGFSNLLDPSTVRYFCGFAAVNESAAIIIPAEGRVTVCSGQASSDFAAAENKLADSELAILPEIGEVSGFEYDFDGQIDFTELFGATAAAHAGVRRIAVLGKLIFPAIIWIKLKAAFPSAELIEYDGALYDQRIIKSENELACIRKAAGIISGTFGAVIPQISAGMTELEIQALFESEMLRRGAESYVQAFAPMVATGTARSHISMTRNTRRAVAEKEILNLAAGCCYEGYNGIICSPHVLGKPPAEIVSAVKAAYDALNATAAKLRPGVGAREVLNTYTDYLTKTGYIDYCPYGSLHSTGMLECEAPVFSVKNDRQLRENMVICIDAYFKGLSWGSFRIEDMYIVGKRGAERITTHNDTFLPSWIE